ncbi:unnamed protein product [Lampetra fluviatilis]
MTKHVSSKKGGLLLLLLAQLKYPERRKNTEMSSSAALLHPDMLTSNWASPRHLANNAARGGGKPTMLQSAPTWLATVTGDGCGRPAFIQQWIDGRR